jgi:hypothetical protein
MLAGLTPQVAKGNGEPDVSSVLDARGGEQLNKMKRSPH